DSDIGRWISADPARQFWDLYAYAGNGFNPINAVDPDGNAAITLGSTAPLWLPPVLKGIGWIGSSFGTALLVNNEIDNFERRRKRESAPGPMPGSEEVYNPTLEDYIGEIISDQDKLARGEILFPKRGGGGKGPKIDWRFITGGIVTGILGLSHGCQEYWGETTEDFQDFQDSVDPPETIIREKR
ncbi:hypothetical protein QA601_18735, partial [Chitinispirillales bacterium ANBcel5]|uniref:hypothetical protein n=1 Tax=Cellulosispirillum alkaliphilum TaxID=3039283 RepID=UPI002A548E5E|nr:hypothetical protein [Chitinispirillales bacterium ANBcel5]